MRSNPHLFAVVLFIAGCSRETLSSHHSEAQPTVVTTTSSAPSASANVFPSSSASTNPPVREDIEDPVLRELRTAAISSVHIASWSRPGFFQATLERPNSAGQARVTMMLALDQHPVVHRKAWGFALLAKALGMRVVPPTVVRRVSTGELGELLANDAEARAYMSAHASVLNDGTIDALVMAPSRGSGQTAWRTISRREIIFTELLEARAWERAVASIEPLPNENKALLRDYVEVLALDYLACNVMRRGVLLDEGDSELLLVDNEGAFPPKNFAHAEAQLLERLKPIVRFPRGMLDALMRFDRERARETFMAGTFDAWILSPRTLMLLDERRLALLSLIAARVEEYGRDVVLSL